MVKEYQKKAYFHGKRFFNYKTEEEILTEEKEKKGLKNFLKWRFSRKNFIEKWPHWIENNIYLKPTSRLEKDNLSTSFINHSTVLIQIAGLNILTDPVWSQRVSPFSFIGPKRVRDAGISINDLPPIDLVLISHDHYDHLDIKTLKLLHEKFQPKIISGLKVNSVLNKHHLNSIELDWWEKSVFNDLEIFFLPAKHWSGRKGFYGNNSTLWGSFVIKSKDKQIYFAGDTAYSKHIQMINSNFGPMDLSLLPIGAYLPRWFMKASHTNPHEAVLIHQELESKNSIAIHHSTFRLSDESYHSPEQDLKIALKELNADKPFRILDFGESWVI